MWVFPHIFLKTYVIAILSQRWGLFSEGDVMKPVKHVYYSYKEASTLWLLASTTDCTIAWIQELYNWAMFSE